MTNKYQEAFMFIEERCKTFGGRNYNKIQTHYHLGTLMELVNLAIPTRVVVIGERPNGRLEDIIYVRKVCPNCGNKEIKQEFSYCPNCGQRILWE